MKDLYVKTWLTGSLALGLLLASSNGLSAQKPGPSRDFLLQFPQDQEFELRDFMRINARTGQPVALYKPDFSTDASLSPEDAGRSFLRSFASVLQLDHADLRDLRLRVAQPNPAGTVLRFSQWLGSLPVFGDDLAITLDRAGKVVFVMNGYVKGVQLSRTTPQITPEAALQAAKSHISATGDLNYSQVRLGVLPTRDRSWLAYAVRIEPQSPLGDFEIMVDAETGAILQALEKTAYHHVERELESESENQLECESEFESESENQHPLAPFTSTYYQPYNPEANPFQAGVSASTNTSNQNPAWPLAPSPLPLLNTIQAIPHPPTPNPYYLPIPVNGTGNVFDADPLSSAHVAYGGAYVDGADANAAVLTAQLQSKTLNQIDLTGGVHTLRGPFASIQDFEAPAKGLFTQASATFAFDRNADNFEAVNTYFFIDHSLRYINQTLLSPCMPFQYAGGMQFDPSGLNGADNSHYLGGSGRIAFGEGGVDDAEDSDVILHELGHGIHDWLTAGNLSQVNGLSEGSGDYWAASYSRSKNQWVPADAAYHFVFNWDGHNPFWGGRTTNYGASYPGGLVNQIHTDGQIWSTCLMLIYNQIGKFQTDKAFIEGLRMTNGSSSQLDAALAVRQAAINLGYTTTEITIITNIFQGCGYNIPNFLPVDYLGFSAERSTATNVELSWETARERDNAGFHLERSTDGVTFGEIGFVPSAGGAHRQAYSFTDLQAPQGTAHYRLRQVDFNGATSYSEVRSVAGMDAALDISLAPQPAHDRLWVRVSGLANASHAELRVFDLEGRELLVRSVSAGELADGYALPLSADWAAGLYLLELRAGAQHLRERFVIDGDR